MKSLITGRNARTIALEKMEWKERFICTSLFIFAWITGKAYLVGPVEWQYLLFYIPLMVLSGWGLEYLDKYYHVYQNIKRENKYHNTNKRYDG